MVQHYRADRREIYRSTPSTGDSDYELVCNLRKTNGKEQEITEVLRSVASLARKTIYASLLELTVSPDDAIIALCAARHLQYRSIIQRAAAVIVSSPLLSDATREEAQRHLGNKRPRTDILGLGIIKVRGANSRLKRN